MIGSSLLLLLAIAPHPVALVPAAVVQDEDAVVDKRPEVQQTVARFTAHVAKKGKEDSQALELVDWFIQEFPNSGPKDRTTIVKAMHKAFSKTRRDKDDGTPDDGLYKALAVGLGEMGPESVKPLISLIGDRKHRHNLGLQRLLILSLGRTEELSAVKPLLDLLGHKDPMVEGAASEALAFFSTAPLKTRKTICKEIIKVLTPLDGIVQGSISVPDIIRLRYDTVAAPMIQTLSAVTGHEERDPQLWQRWWNNNKKRDWDAEDE